LQKWEHFTYKFLHDPTKTFVCVGVLSPFFLKKRKEKKKCTSVVTDAMNFITN